MRLVILLLITILTLSGCGSNTATKPTGDNKKTIEITDDTGQKIVIDKAATRIISLYSAHTENLFSLGLDKEIIGIGLNDNYPSDTKNKHRFDYRADPEKIIAQEPDLVLIRPFVKRGFPDFVKTLERAGIKVVSLYPERYQDFPAYINTLAKLTGKESKAQELLATFDKNMSELAAKTPKQKLTVFFEATGNMRTITPGAIPAGVLEKLGLSVLFIGKPVVDKGSSISAFDTEELLVKSSAIDVYIAQKGVMNPKVSISTIRERAGFENIKAIKNNNIIIIDEKLISSPTFRLYDGAKQIADFIQKNN